MYRLINASLASLHSFQGKLLLCWARKLILTRLEADPLVLLLLVTQKHSSMLAGHCVLPKFVAEEEKPRSAAHWLWMTHPVAASLKYPHICAQGIHVELGLGTELQCQCWYNYIKTNWHLHTTNKRGTSQNSAELLQCLPASLHLPGTALAASTAELPYLILVLQCDFKIRTACCPGPLV